MTKIAYVQAGWHQEITDGCKTAFFERIVRNGFSAQDVEVFAVPGSLEIPLVAKRLAESGRSVILAAADTFRAGAIDQLRIWAGRVGAEFVGAQPGADPASVAFDALDAAGARGCDVVIIDTAGRLQIDEELMGELAAVRKAVEPDEVLLVVEVAIEHGAHGCSQ